MKKVLALAIAIVMVLSFTGCKSGVKLEEGQSHETYNIDKGTAIMIQSIEDRDLEKQFDVDYDDDSEKDIAEEIIDQFDDYYDFEPDVKVKKGKDYATITIKIDDIGDMNDMDDELEMSLQDYIEDYGYDDIEDYLDDYDLDFQTYKGEDKLKSDDMEEYEDDYIFQVSGGEEGGYYTFDTEILAVSRDVDYKYVNKNTIFIEDDEYGPIILKEN